MLSLYKRLGTEWNGIEWNTIAKVSVLSPNGGVTNRTETAVYACTSCSADTNLVSWPISAFAALRNTLERCLRKCNVFERKATNFLLVATFHVPCIHLLPCVVGKVWFVSKKKRAIAFENSVECWLKVVAWYLLVRKYSSERALHRLLSPDCAKRGFTCVSRFPALLTRLPRSRETRRMRVGTHLKSHCCSPVFLQAAQYAPKAKDLLRNFSTSEKRPWSTRLFYYVSIYVSSTKRFSSVRSNGRYYFRIGRLATRCAPPFGTS